MQVGDAADILPKINACREENEWDVIAHTMDSHPPDHCSFVDNHDGAKTFALEMIPTPDGTGTMEQVMWPRHCVEGSEGWQIADDLKVAKSDFIQRKGQDKKVIFAPIVRSVKCRPSFPPNPVLAIACGNRPTCLK